MKLTTSAFLLCVALVSCASPQRPAANAPPSATSRATRLQRGASAPTLSDADQVREIAAVERLVTTLRWQTQRRLDTARGRGDHAGVRCLDEGLNELDATMRLVAEQRARFEDGTSGDLSARRGQSFRRVMILRARAEEVRDETARCELGVVIDGTVTTVVEPAT